MRGMVACAHPAGADAGADALRNGGNAVDAVVAAALAMGVVEPLDCGLGAGGFLLVHMNGETAALDFMGRAPRATDYRIVPRWGGFLRDYSLAVAGSENEWGGRSVAVPGAAAGLAAAMRRYGSLPLPVLAAPAVRLAVEGFPVNKYLSQRMEKNSDYLHRQPDALHLFTVDGRPYREGEILRNPEMAETVRHLATEGLEAFYTGPVADAITSEMERRGGFLNREDLTTYRAHWKAPMQGRYRGYTVLSAPPPSTGAYLILALHCLERADLPPAAGPKVASAVLEAMQVMGIQRGDWLGDPAFVPVPTWEATEPERAKELLAALRGGQLRPGTAGPGEAGTELPDTTHISAVDREGNLTALTFSLMNFSGIAVPGHGFMLNNQMLLFNPWPGTANSVAPGKRPASSMTPTLILRHGAPLGAIGASGGPRILSAILQTLVGRLDLGLPAAEAVQAPRFHWEGGKVWAEPAARASAEAASAGRWQVAEVPDDELVGVCQCVFIDSQSGDVDGAADPRAGGGVAVS
ncbi:MAG: gamma-glutamyltransferase [Anaerolineae bacterium]